MHVALGFACGHLTQLLFIAVCAGTIVSVSTIHLGFFFWGSGALLMTKKNGIFYACLVSSKKGESMFWCFLNIHMEYSMSLCFG